MMKEQVGIRILELRRSRKITLPDLAEKLGVSPETVQSWENGQAYPDIPLLPLLARELETSIDYLIQGKVEKVQKLFVGSTDLANPYMGETLIDKINRQYLEKGWKIVHTDMVDRDSTVILVVVEK